MSQEHSLGVKWLAGLTWLLLLTHCGGQASPEPLVAQEPAGLASSWAERSSSTTQVSVPAVADTFVDASQPTRNFGGAPTLVTAHAPARELYLRFIPSPVHGTVTRAALRLFTISGTQAGPRVYLAGSQWEEGLVTWNTRPSRLEGPLDAKAAVPGGTWLELDVTRAVYGSGEYNFVLVGAAGAGASFHSRESPQAALRPQLVLTVEDALGCMPLPPPSQMDPSCTYHGTGGGLTRQVRHEGGPLSERLQALAVDTRGGFVAAIHGRHGTGTPLCFEALWLTRHTASGAPRWRRLVTTGGVTVEDLAVTRGDHILAVGRYQGAPWLGTRRLPPARSEAFFIARFSPDGLTEWAHGFEAHALQAGVDVAMPSLPREVATDSQGNLLVAGGFHGELDLGGGPLFAGLPSVDTQASEKVPGGFVAKFSAAGAHLWSKAFPADAPRIATEVRSVATDGGDHVLIGVDAYHTDMLPDGPVGVARPSIMKYSPSGALLWRREFTGTHGQLRGVRTLGAHEVAFLAYLVLPTTFGGRAYITGSTSWDTFVGADPSAYVGTLSAAGGDGWLRRLIPSTVEDGHVDALVTGADDTLTVTGHGEYLDFGGGLFRPHDAAGFQAPAAFVARYSRTGIHLWSRIFDIDFQGASPSVWLYLQPQKPWLHVEPLPDGSVLAGGDFTFPILLQGQSYTSRGGSDVLFQWLEP